MFKELKKTEYLCRDCKWMAEEPEKTHIGEGIVYRCFQSDRENDEPYGPNCVMHCDAVCDFFEEVAEIKLKTCPFCDSPVEGPHRVLHLSMWQIRCPQWCVSYIRRTREELLTHWNDYALDYESEKDRDYRLGDDIGC